jgi:lipopolysaccharide transport system ATP-binding protein
VAEAFLAKTGDLLVSGGYEPDSSWAEKLGVATPAMRTFPTAVLVRPPEKAKSDFTLIHLTHAKAGSSWIYHILTDLFPDRIAPRGRKLAEATGGDLSKHGFAAGGVYGAMFMRADEFDAHPELSSALRFVMIRDLRDTLVSLYFSIKISHPLDAEGKRQRERETLQSLSEEDGLLHLMETQLGGAAEVQSSWLGRDELLYRYEDLLPRDYTLLRELLLERFRLPITEKALRRAIGKYSFEALYKRKLGEENTASHGRQGAPGNWRKHFTPRVAEAFAQRFGQLLIDTGYERDQAWANLPG